MIPMSNGDPVCEHERIRFKNKNVPMKWRQLLILSIFGGFESATPAPKSNVIFVINPIPWFGILSGVWYSRK